MVKIYLCVFLFFCHFSAIGQVTFEQIPHNLQLYPRDANSQAEVIISGTINGTGYTKIGVRVLRAGVQTKVVSQTVTSTSDQAAFRLATIIKAEPAEYAYQVFLYTATDSLEISEALTSGFRSQLITCHF